MSAIVTPAPKAHHRRPGYRDVLEVLRRLLELAGQADRPGSRLEARKVRHHDNASFYAWTLDGRRAKGATPRRSIEYALGWVDGAGVFQGPPGQTEPAMTWEAALHGWARAVAAGSPENPDLQDALARIEALAMAAEARRLQPRRTKIETAHVWLQCYFGARTELPAGQIITAARARSISPVTLALARRRAGYTTHQRWENGHNVHLWRRPLPAPQPQHQPDPDHQGPEEPQT